MRSESVSRRNRTRSSYTAVIAAVLALSGCATMPASRSSVGVTDLRDEALTCLKAAIRYPHNPAVRMAAVEALERVSSEDTVAWVRTALTICSAEM